jgi:hypothetical protein
MSHSPFDLPLRARGAVAHRYAVEPRSDGWALLSDDREVGRYPEPALAATAARRLADALRRLGLRTEVVLPGGSGAEGRRSESEAA